MDTGEFPSLEDREREARTVVNPDNDANNAGPVEGNRLARCVSCRLFTEIRHITSKTRNTTHPLCHLCHKRDKRLEKVSRSKREKKSKDKREPKNRHHSRRPRGERHKDKKHGGPIVTAPLKKPLRTRMTIGDKVVSLVASTERLASDVHEVAKSNRLLASTVNAIYMMLSGRQRDASGPESRNPLENLQLHAPPPVESPSQEPVPSRETKKMNNSISSISSISSSDLSLSDDVGSDSEFSESSSSSESSVIDEEYVPSAPKHWDNNVNRVAELRKAMAETQDKKTKK